MIIRNDGGRAPSVPGGPVDAIRVRAGDTLSSIAERHGTSVEALSRLNGIRDANRIVAGTTLRLPGRIADGTYTVRAGDTLSEIASATGTTIGALQRLNGLRNPDMIFPGQSLRLHGPAGRPAAPAPAPAPTPASPGVPSPPPTTGAAPPAQAGGTGGLSQAGLDALYSREAQAGVSNHPHWPGGNSGVTLGPGYDMRGRTRNEVVRDLTAIGVSPAAADRLSRGAGLRGDAAREFARANHNAVALSSAQERALFANVVPSYAAAVRAAVRVPLTQNQFDALVSFTYNVGVSAFNSSNLLARLNAGDIAAVPAELRRWNRSGGAVSRGLVNRREQEVAQFARPSGPAGTQTAPQSAPANGVPTGMPATPADWAARIGASGDATARRDLERGLKVVVAVRVPTSTFANNNRGLYDDRIAIVQKSANGGYRADVFIANTEPTSRYDGQYGIDMNGDGRIELGAVEPGSYRYTREPGLFYGHAYWRPDAITPARRDANHDGHIDRNDPVDTRGAGRSMLIHTGSNNFTGSAGCQTMPPAVLDRFRDAMGTQRSFSYVLTVK